MNTKKQVLLIAVAFVCLIGLVFGAYTMTQKNSTDGTQTEDTTSVAATSSSAVTVASDGAVEKLAEEPSEEEGEDTQKEEKDKEKSDSSSKTKKKESEEAADKSTEDKTSTTVATGSKKTKSKKATNSKKTTKSKNASETKKTSDKASETAAPKEEEKDYTAQVGGITISSKDAACEISGKTATIKQAGTYNLSGSATDAQIVVNAAKTASVILVCKGVSVTNSNSSALYIKSADAVALQLEEGTKNTFTDGTAYALAAGATEPDGAIFSQDDLTISGSGSLTVNGRYLDGIVCKNDLKIQSGTVSVTAKDDGLRGKDSVQISGGKVEIVSEAHGIKSTEDADSSKGYVEITGGDTSVDAVKDGIHSVNYIKVSGGKLYVDAKNESIDTDSSFTISGGTVILDGPKSVNHASLTCGKGYYLNGGTFLSVGSSSLIKSPAAGSKQKYLFYTCAQEQEKDSKVQIKSSTGNILIEHVTTRKFQNIIFSSSELKSGSYAIYSKFTRLGECEAS